MEFLGKINENKFNLAEFVEREANIWACIYRAINRKKHTDEYDEEDLIYKPKFARSLTIDIKSSPDKFDISKNRSGAMPQALTPLTENAIIEEESDDGYSDSPGNSGIKLNPHRKPSSKMNVEITEDSDSLGDISYSDDEDIPAPLLSSKQVNLILTENTKQSSNFSQSDFSKMSSTRVIRSDSKINENTRVEEMLVMYYITIVIRLCKLSDGRKAIIEYSKKKNLSVRAQAHLHQFRGVLSMMYTKKDAKEIEMHFNNAFKCYEQIKSTKGMAICKLALLRIKCEKESNQSLDSEELDELISDLVIVRKSFDKIKYTLGINRVNSYIETLQKKHDETSEKPTFKKLMRFKTLKKSHIANITAKDTNLGESILHDEDIKLFTTVIEFPIVFKTKLKRDASYTKDSETPQI